MIDSVAFDLPSYPVDAAPLWVDALAVAAGSVGVASQWPQVWRLWRTGRYAGLSTLSCILNLLTPATWLAYGLSQLSGVQIVMNSLALLGSAGVLLGLVSRAGLRLRAWLPSVLGGLTAIATIALVGGTPVAGAVASVVTLAMALPQVWLLLRGRITGVLDASGVSRTRWGMSALCNVGWVSYGVLVTDPAIAFTATTMVLSSTAVLVLCVGAAAAPVLRAVPDLPAGRPGDLRPDLPAGRPGDLRPDLPAGRPGDLRPGRPADGTEKPALAGGLPSERVACSP